MAKYKGTKRNFAQAVDDLSPKKTAKDDGDSLKKKVEEDVDELLPEEDSVSEDADAVDAAKEADKKQSKDAEAKNADKEADSKEDEAVDNESETAEQEMKNGFIMRDKNDELAVVHKKELKKTDSRKKELQNVQKKEIRMSGMEQEIHSSEEILGLGEDTTYITKGTIVNGNIETDGDIEILGRIDGNVRCAGKLIISGRINGDINTTDLYAEAANISGEIIASGTVKIGAGTVTVGNISAFTATIAGAVKGDVDVKDSVIIDSTAVVVGNIKSRDVQVNSGAIIDGFCKQVHSDVDVDKFFKDGIENLE